MVAYKFFNKCDERLEVLLKRQVELIPIFEVDWDCLMFSGL